MAAASLPDEQFRAVVAQVCAGCDEDAAGRIADDVLLGDDLNIFPRHRPCLLGKMRRRMGWLVGTHRTALLKLLGIIQPAYEQEVGDLLDHLDRVGDAAGPEVFQT